MVHVVKVLDREKSERYFEGVWFLIRKVFDLLNQISLQLKFILLIGMLIAGHGAK